MRPITPSSSLGTFPGRLALGDFELDATTRRLTRAGKRVPLTQKPFQVLTYLLAHRQRLVTRSELLAGFWKGGEYYEEALTRCISSIRKALEDQGDPPLYIETRWAEGYRYIGPYAELAAKHGSTQPAASASGGDLGLREVPAVDSELSRPPAVPDPAAVFAGRRWRVWLLAAVSIVILLAAAGLYQRATQRSAAIRSVAVLPFANLSGDPANDYLSEGMTDGLITALSKIEGLTVISQFSVFRFKGQHVTQQDAGRKLDVATVLEGSVRKDADSVRVVARLVRVEDSRVLWTDDTQDQPLGDLSALQDALARSVATQLGLQLNDGNQQGRARPATRNALAQEHYLKGRHFWNRRTEEDLKKAVAHFDQALALDPAYALAHAGLADTWLLLPFYGTYRHIEAYPRARAAALRALELDPTLAEPHAALALVREQYDYDWAGAEAGFKRALELNPNYATAHQWYSELLSYTGRFDEAIVEITRARELDPLSLIITTLVGSPHLWKRDYSRALEHYQQALELDPGFALATYMSGLSYDGLGRHDEAIAAYNEALPQLGLGVLGAPLVHAFAKSGRLDQARRVLDELLAAERERPVPPFKIATAYAGIGDKQSALDWLERAYQEHDDRLVLLKVEPQLDSLRQEPRLLALQKRVGLQP